MTDEPPMIDRIDVIEITAEQTHELRRAVLRKGLRYQEVHFPEDEKPLTFHLGAALDTVLVATSTWTPAPCPRLASTHALQLRGMATRDGFQGRGIGTCLITEAIDRARRAGHDLVWANARDSALGFYERLGLSVVGDGFVTADTQLPHHVVVLAL